MQKSFSYVELTGHSSFRTSNKNDKIDCSDFILIVKHQTTIALTEAVNVRKCILVKFSVGFKINIKGFRGDIYNLLVRGGRI